MQMCMPLLETRMKYCIRNAAFLAFFSTGTIAEYLCYFKSVVQKIINIVKQTKIYNHRVFTADYPQVN